MSELEAGDINQAREQVIHLVLDANTLTEIETAKQALREWMKAHPEENGMRDGFEQLYQLQEIVEEQEAERAQSMQETGALAGAGSK